MHLCQPDARKGCSACCGLFNFSDISRERLEGYLSASQERAETARIQCTVHGREIGTVPDARDHTSHICPFQGFIAPGRPGCTLHPGVCGCDCRDRSLFGSKICDGFLCPAHAILDPMERELLVEAVDDWYPYAIALIDPEAFRWIAREARALAPGMRADDDASRSAITSALLARAAQLARYAGPLFFYSIPEYNLGRHELSLPEKEAIRGVLRERFGGPPHR